MKGRSFPFFIRFFLSVACILIGLNSYAQGTFTVSLKLVDAKTDEPVSFATASLTVKGETSAAKYVLTDSEGAASLTKVKKGTYILKAELMGYKSHEQELVVDKNLDLGQIKMKEDVVLGIGVNGVLPASGRERDMSAIEIVFVTYFSNKPKAKLRLFSCVFPFP